MSTYSQDRSTKAATNGYKETSLTGLNESSASIKKKMLRKKLIEEQQAVAPSNKGCGSCTIF